MAKAKKEKALKVLDENQIDEILDEVTDLSDTESLDPVEVELKRSYEEEKKNKKQLNHKRFDKFKGSK